MSNYSGHKTVNWLLILQGWTMLWVVIGHSNLEEPGCNPVFEEFLYSFAYSFHMPLFMLISGWLFYYTRLSSSEINNPWTFGGVLKDKVVRILIPGLVFSIIAYAVKLAFPGDVSRQVSLNGAEIAHSYLYPNDNPLRELWFLVTLFWFFALFPLWKAVLSKNWSTWILLLVLCVLHFVHPQCELLCLDRVFDFAIWFYLGIIASRYNAVDKLKGKHFVWFLPVSICIYVLGRVYSPFIATVGGILLSFSIALVLDKLLPSVFSSFRKYTYQIFLLGIFVQILVKILYHHHAWPYIPCYLLCILLGIYVPVIVAKTVEMINWEPLMICYGLKKRPSTI